MLLLRENALREPQVVTDALGGSPLARAAAEGLVPAGWYAPRLTTPEEWRARAARVAGRTDVARWLDALRAAMNPAGAAAAR
ncbi:MAG: hypothetical protein ACREON_15830, partial [Gemmatimonadaceae bacterium]